MRGTPDSWRRCRLSLLGVLILLSACSVPRAPIIDFTPSNEASNQAWAARKARLERIDHWQLRAKLAVRSGARGGQGTLRWTRRPDYQKIELAGPLGGGRVEVEVEPERVVLRDTRGKVLTGSSAAALLEARLGWPLPFDALSDWVRGQPSSENYTLKLDAAGQVVSMNDGGWQVSYPEYQAIPLGGEDGVLEQLPRRINVNALPGHLSVYAEDGEYLGDELFMRVVLSAWQLR